MKEMTRYFCEGELRDTLNKVGCVDFLKKNEESAKCLYYIQLDIKHGYKQETNNLLLICLISAIGNAKHCKLLEKSTESKLRKYYLADTTYTVPTQDVLSVISTLP